MRTALTLFALSLAPAALAGEPAPCRALSDAETAALDARTDLDELREIAFGEEYTRKLAWVEAEDRDAMVAARDVARRQLPEARRTFREARRSWKQARLETQAGGLVCAPPEDGDATNAG